jgi:hypothetical protein
MAAAMAFERIGVSAAPRCRFGFLGSEATDLTYVSPQLPLALDDRSTALIQLIESLGG